MNFMPYLLEMKNISKSFYGVDVLHKVSFSVKSGTVHALCGENGAGKSTLMKILSGLYKSDCGEIFIKGEKIVINKPVDAIRHGIAMIYQELLPIAGMKVSENIFLGREPARFGIVNFRRLNQEANELLSEFSCTINANTLMGRLKVSDMQLVEIVKAVFYNFDILIMDEPTSALTDREIETLFSIIRKLKSKGKGIIYISHKMKEIFEISDEITLLRDGEFIGNWDTDKVDLDAILYGMVGRKLDTVYPKRESEIGKVVFEVNNLQKKGRYHDVTFNVRKGEILGIYGLMGAGRTEVMETLFGLNKRDGGEVKYNFERVNFKHPSEAYKKGIAFVTEDRRRFGIFPDLSVMHNITMTAMYLVTIFKTLINSRKEKIIVKDIYNKLQIKSRSLKQLVKSLSGGNQQKVIIAKMMLTNPNLLILDEPTRGIDVGAKQEIYKIMNDYCSRGKSIIFISSELPELFGMSDRIVVFSNGTVVGEVGKSEFDQTKVMRLAMSKL